MKTNIKSLFVLPALMAVAPLSPNAAVNPTVPPDVFYVAGSTRKISQLIGDTDFETLKPTLTRTESRVGLTGTDLGVSFVHKGVTYLVFGDTIGGGVFGDRDSMAVTMDTDLESGLDLTFLADGSVWRPITIPGISQGSFEVPLDGVSVSDRMYLYHSTDHSDAVTMGRSVVAVSDDDGQNFTLLYTVSTNHFINISVSKVNLADWPGFPEVAGEGLVLFGSGSYRASDVRLAFQPAAGVNSPDTLRYFAGLDGASNPMWSLNEADAIDLFDQPCVGELSVGWNKFIKRWVMLYNCDNPRGINFRTARQPWGPWSTPQVLFDPWNDLGYAHFMHVNWSFRIFDSVENPGREYEWGGEYGPYMFKELATGSDNRTTIYFTMSSWNPYVCVLMKSQLTVGNAPIITMPPTDQQIMAGQDATFQLTASAVGALAYQWQRSGTNLPGATSNAFLLATVSATDDGAQFRCRVSNASGSVTSNPARLTLTATNHGPLPSILSPAVNALYSGGETISFQGTARDPEDGVLPADAFCWRVMLHHGNHTVPFLGTLCGVTNGSFTVPVRGEQATNVFFRIWLTVTDSGGRTTTVSRDILPRCVTLTLAAQPSGASVSLDGQTVVTPRATNSVVGMERTLSASAPAILGGRSYDWLGWADGGAVSRSIIVPATNATYLAMFRPPTTLIATNSVWKYLVTSTAPAAIVVPTSQTNGLSWRYTTSTPATDWYTAGFDDSAWSTGLGAFGAGNPPDTAVLVRTDWSTSDIWLRRTFNPGPLTAQQSSNLVFFVYHDEDVEIYINGVLAGSAPGYTTTYVLLPMNPAGQAAIIPNANNTIAVHCHQTDGGQYIDVGIRGSWKDVGFDDAAWASGAAQLGYGEGDEATIIGFGPDPNNRYTTTYFRQSFTVADPNVFGGALVRFLRDDGGVVYLNGTEVFRSNMGGGLPDWPIMAPTTSLPADGTTTYYLANVPADLLRPGTNVMAVEIHLDNANSPDLSFALELRAAEHDPRLAIAQVGTNVELSWPYPSDGYALQSAYGLNPGSIWTTLNPPVTVTNNQNRVTLSATSSVQFYRLAH